jgi:hypothetical protein
MDQNTRNTLRNVVTQCRRLLEDSVAQVLQGQFGIFAAGKKDEVQIEPEARMSHLSEEDRAYRQDLLDHFDHIKALGYKAKDALAQLIREVAFTHLNRFCAYRMMESRGLIRESVSKGLKSQGFLFYLADHDEDERRYNTGQQDLAYRHFLNWLGGTLSEEIGVLFAPTDPANRLYTPQRVIDEVLGLLNAPELAGIWSEDEAIGWVYQYFTPKELRDQARKESQAPRNSYELAFRNQFFTPRYVVEFLTDNTLGRIWYEMRRGETRLNDQCRYMVRRPTEVFLKEGEKEPDGAATATADLSQEELLKLPVYVPFRAKKDPRELRILDPACGSGHFLLYCFDLLLTIYEEAYSDPDLGPALKKDYPSLDDLRRHVPRLILAHNLHGIDIDLRASQIAALALWLRCQRAYQEMGVKQDRPKITRSNVVCAEPMPGEAGMLKEFVCNLEPKVLSQVVEVVFDKMSLAGEAGSLLQIREELREAVAAAKQQYGRETTHAVDRRGRTLLFSEAEMQRLGGGSPQGSLFDLSGVTDDQFFEQAEAKALDALRQYAEEAQEAKQLQRRLFTEDAVRGFAFIDLFQRPFDVVLMNPPFGSPSKASKEYLDRHYPQSKNDLFATFIDRGLSLLNTGGHVGAITSRTGFFLTSFSSWRDEVLLAHSTPTVFADLGSGVLDAAVVETAACTLEKRSLVARSKAQPSFFLRLLRETDKPPVLADAIVALNRGSTTSNPVTYVAVPASFANVPGSPLSYWASDAIRGLFRSLPVFDDEAKGRSTRCGLGTLDDFRFLRLRWEVCSSEIGDTWKVYYHGGTFSPFHDEFPCVVLWANNGAAVKRFVEDKVGSASRKVQGEGHYFRSGFVFPRRTKGFAPKFMPEGGIFSTAGQAGFVPLDDLAWTIALMSSSTCTFLLSLSQGRTGDAAQFEVGLVKRLPWPKLDMRAKNTLAALALNSFNATVTLRSWQETSHFFVIPPGMGNPGTTLSDRFTAWEKEQETARQLVANNQTQINEIALGLYRISARDLAFTDTDDDHSDGCEEQDSSDDTESRIADTLSMIEPGGCIRALVSYLVGCVLGRWDGRWATLHFQPEDSTIPTQSLPSVSIGERIPPGTDGRQFRSVVGTGVLVDDEANPADIIGLVRGAIQEVFPSTAEAIESEASEMLAVRTLRDYFRKTGKGGFWEDHVTRYSAARRKAPIYWLLQSSKKNYAIWLYYHRLDKDILFKALVNYVEPKIRLENDRLVSLRSQKASGEASKGAKKLDKEIEKQEEFLSELRDFEEKLRRAANLNLVPDLNDGVVLNIAPLHELVPWKEAEKYWEELLEGKYEWSSIGKQLREKGLVK